MTARRLPQGGLIDRTRRLSFRFDGRRFTGHPGDSLASALLAAGVRVMGRSFKYHRPRGVWGAWVDDPNAVMNVTLAGLSRPNCPATTTLLEDGMQARAVNAWPSAGRDLKGGLDLFHRLMPAGFYYKTFMWPDWHLFEPMIRRMAGLGALEGETPPGWWAEQGHDACELLVIGAGAAGLAAARAAAEAGQEVVLVDDRPAPGGGLYARARPVEGQPPAEWVAAQIAAFQAAGGRLMRTTTAIGAYDHGLVALVQERGFALPPRLIRMRPARVLLAAGAIDRPLTFADNDRPGVMATAAALEYLGRYGVLVGERIALIDNGNVENAATVLSAAGAEVTLVDPAAGPLRALGRGGVRGLKLGRRRLACEVLLASAGRVPLVHLWRHAGGGLDWAGEIAAFVPGRAPVGWAAIGAVNGTYGLNAALEEARAAALAEPGSAAARTAPARKALPGLWPDPRGAGGRGRQWVDFQHDVTLRDIALAARENYTSVEHLKRYTTLGMASDQGKTANMPGLAAMAALRGRTIPETGTTTFRPPFVPVPMASYAGVRQGQLFAPLKRLPLEAQHRAAGAGLGEYGGWLRPGWYGADQAAAIRAETLMVRRAAGILDASPLGKIEVMGPDAAAFLDFIYYNTISTLPEGHIRYGLILREDGVVFDDGVVARLGPAHFLLSCSSSHVTGLVRMLESWRQDGHDPDRILVHDVTAQWATVTVTGPKAGAIMARLGFEVAGLAHMRFRAARFQGAPARLARVSFTGEASHEISVPAGRAAALWQAALAAGAELGAGPLGLEALSVLRAEKGYVIIGQDTDGTTMPHDLGFAGPRARKLVAFVGDRALHSEAACDPNRRQLVGLAVPEGAGAEGALPVGAHLVDEQECSIGVVTSSHDSAFLGHPIALALLERGRARLGEAVSVWHMGARRPARVVAPCFLDPKGERLHAQ